MGKLGVGVLGVGEMGKRHAENLRRLVPEAQLVAVADVDAGRARQVAAELEIGRYYDSSEALFECKDIQAVVIAVPDKFHAPAVQAAAAAGKAILCEKPLATTLEDAKAALDAVARAGVRLQVGFMRRYDPAYEDAKRRIEAGEIGEPVIFKAIGRDRDAPPLSYYEASLNGMLFLNSSIHDFDLARWLMHDEVAEVHSYVTVLPRPEVAKFDDIVAGVVNLRFQRGAIGNVESYAQAQYGYDIRTEIVGSKGTLMVGTLRETAEVVLTGSGSRHDVLGHFLVRFADAYAYEMRDFVQNNLAGRPPRVTGQDGLRAVEIALAARQSYQESRPVHVRDSVPVARNSSSRSPHT